MHRLFVFVLVAASACDHGLAPPDAPAVGTINVEITYLGHPGSWPSADSLHDLRFVAMRFVPTDTADFLQLNRLVFSDPLRHNVPTDTTVVSDVETGPFFYAGVAQKYGPNAFDWRPVGLVQADDGIFVIRAGETTQVSVRVDFRHPPPFPPPGDQ